MGEVLGKWQPIIGNSRLNMYKRNFRLIA